MGFPLVIFLMPLWIGHVATIGIYIFLCHHLYKVCLISQPVSRRNRHKYKAQLQIDAETVPVLQSFVVAGCYLLLGTAMLVLSEIFLYFKMSGQWRITFLCVALPLLVGSFFFFIQGVVCKGQTLVASISWLLLFLGFLGAALDMDYVLPRDFRPLATFAPFWLLIIILICHFARMLVFHQLGTILLTIPQQRAATGYLIGLVLLATAGNVFSGCNYGLTCSHNQIVLMGILTLLVEVFFFASVFMITQQQGQMPTNQASRKSDPLPLAQKSTGEWVVDTTQGHFSVVLIGCVEYDLSKSAIYQHGVARALFDFFCCGQGFKARENSEKRSSREQKAF